MATLPDGTTVNSQTVEGWNIDPPPTAGLSITSAQTVATGGTVEVTGSVTIDGAAASGETVSLNASGPESIDTPDPVTDANGDYSVTVGPFEEPGDYTITSEVNGIQEQITEGWNQ
jgi:hypothetical protein